MLALVLSGVITLARAKVQHVPHLIKPTTDMVRAHFK